MSAPRSERLEYHRVTGGDAEALLALAREPHVRRFLLDGAVVGPAWGEAELRRSEALFAEHGVGLWLTWERGSRGLHPPVGFCGFRMFADLHPDLPELLYAFTEASTGCGLATEAARALVRFAREVACLQRVVSAVDEPNAASVRVLRKLGFRETAAVPGPFGRILLFELPDDDGSGPERP